MLSIVLFVLLVVVVTSIANYFYTRKIVDGHYRVVSDRFLDENNQITFKKAYFCNLLVWLPLITP